MERIAAQIGGAVRRGGLRALGCVFGIVALVFLTVAAWIAAVEAYGSLAAALLIAAGYFLLALILFLAAGRRPPPLPEPVKEPRKPAPPLFEAFMTGLRTGRTLRRK